MNGKNNNEMRHDNWSAIYRKALHKWEPSISLMGTLNGNRDNFCQEYLGSANRACRRVPYGLYRNNKWGRRLCLAVNNW